MNKYFFSSLFFLFSTAALADVSCKIIRGQESIEVRVYDAFVGKTAQVVRFHPLVNYPTKDVAVTDKETTRSIIFTNSRKGFHLKLNKEFNLADDGSSFLKGEFKFEDISTSIRCLVE